MIVEILVALTMTLAVPPTAPLSQRDVAIYAPLIGQAAIDCKNARGKKIDVGLLWKLAAVESTYNPPPKVRGMILAAACMESGYNPKARGDRKFSKSGRVPLAIGILQMWPIYERMFPWIVRTDPELAAHGWMKHITNMIPRVKRRCRYKTPEKIWIAAWVTGIRSKKKGGRCKQKPNHLRILKRWHRTIEKQRLIQDDCYNIKEDIEPKAIDGDGC